MNQPPQYDPQNPQYPPLYPNFSAPPQPTRKKPLWPWIVALVLALLVASCCALVAIVNPGQHSPAVTQSSGKWGTTHTFRGDGIKKTPIFAASNDWKLQWQCTSDPANVGGYNLIVTVYTDTNTIQDISVNTICKPGNTSGETEEHQGGNIYLDVNSEASWFLTVQEPE